MENALDDWWDNDFSCKKEECDLCWDCFQKIKKILETNYITKKRYKTLAESRCKIQSENKQLWEERGRMSKKLFEKGVKTW